MVKNTLFLKILPVELDIIEKQNNEDGNTKKNLIHIFRETLEFIQNTGH